MAFQFNKDMEIEKYSPKWLLNEIRNSESDAHALFKIIDFQEALTEQCNIADAVGQSEQLKDLKEPTFEEWLKANFIPFGSNGFTNRDKDAFWTKGELAEVHATLHI